MGLRNWLRKTPWVHPKRRLEWYPPFQRMGIRVLDLSGDWRRIIIRLPLNRYTRNPGGGMFGGHMACLADPIAALACHRVFPGWAIWSRDLYLDFRKEARGDLVLRFEMDPAIERQVALDLAENQRATPRFELGYFLADGSLAARVYTRVALRPARLGGGFGSDGAGADNGAAQDILRGTEND